MFRRKQVVQDEFVARHMMRFFGALPDELRRDPEMVAKSYGQFLWDGVYQRLVERQRSSRSRFYVGLSIGDSSRDFADITKRAALISDTLLLSHHQIENYHDLTESYDPNLRRPTSLPMGIGQLALPRYALEEIWRIQMEGDRNHLTEMYGMCCPSLGELGRWILDAKSLLTAGLVWYLPSYATATYRITDGVRVPFGQDKVTSDAVIDYLIQDGRAVDASGAEPIKSRLVRPVLQIDLPFIEGVNLRDFSKITIGEFDAYAAFRDFLRERFLDMDTALNADQPDCELRRLGLQIKDGIRSVRTEMEAARRKRAIKVTGAAIGTVGAILVAVNGPALAAAVLAAAVAAICSRGGVWDIIDAAAENSTSALRQDKWYYVWALNKKSNTPVI